MAIPSLPNARRAAVLAPLVLAALALGACSDQDLAAPAAPERAQLGLQAAELARVEVKVQSGQCNVDGSTVTFVNVSSGERFLGRVNGNVALVQVKPGVSYLVHWRNLLYENLADDDNFGAVAPFVADTAQATPNATAANCGGVIYNKALGNNNLALNTTNYLAIVKNPSAWVTVTADTKLNPISVGSVVGARVRGKLLDSTGKPLALDSINVYRIQPWPGGASPVPCFPATAWYCKAGLSPGLLDAQGTVQNGEFDLGSAQEGTWLVELRAPNRGRGKIFVKPFQATGDQTVDLQLVEQDRLKFTYYVDDTHDDRTVGAQALSMGTGGWTLLKDGKNGEASDTFQVAFSFVGQGRFTLSMLTDAKKTVTVTAECKGGRCTQLSGTPSVKSTVSGAEMAGEGTVIFTVPVPKVNSLCFHVFTGTVEASAGDRAPNAGCVNARKSDGNGGTWVVPT